MKEENLIQTGPLILSQEKIEVRSKELHNIHRVFSSDTQYVNNSGKDESTDYYLYKHLNVHKPKGSVLDDFPKATIVKVYATDISWQFRQDPGAKITTPTGMGGRSGAETEYPGQSLYGIVMYQENGNKYDITGTSPPTAQKLQILDGELLRFAINDRKGTYGDNYGAFSIRIKIIQ